MVVVTYLLIGFYAMLTAIAGIAQWREKGFYIRTLLFIIVSITIFMSLWASSKLITLYMLMVSFIILHVLAIAEGLLVNGILRLSHHIIRFGLHVFFIILVYQFVM